MPTLPGDADLFQPTTSNWVRVSHHTLMALGELRHETQQLPLESLRIQPAQHTGKGVVAGDDAFRAQKRLQEIPFGVAEEFRVGASPAAAGDGA